ncbi:MAG: cytochrome c biogenesis protein CcsA [Psychroserpens sp.]|uniref:cytochrome c biogenesis protein n=1 Tax=Psychroserpens sp. TaxID=2020870 RepID=UPI003002F7FC
MIKNNLAKILFSTRLTSILFIIFAASMAVGTFMDAGQETSPTAYSRNLIYNAWWFEAIMGLFVINFSGNIFKYKLYKKGKWATLTFHLGFIFILLGAFVTRYIGFEGVMSIPEGATENRFFSQKTFVTAQIDGDYQIDGGIQRLSVEHEVDFSDRLNNKFKVETKYNQQPVFIELEKFIVGAEEDIIPDENGEEYLKIVEAGDGSPHNHFLKPGQTKTIHNVIFTLNNPIENAINIHYNDNKLFIQSPVDGEYMTMATRASGHLLKDSIQPLLLRSRYIIGNLQMVFPKPVIKGKLDVVKKPQILKSDEDGIVLKVSVNDETKYVNLIGGQGTNPTIKRMSIGDLDIGFRYGSKILELPFKVKLNDFIADRYPGTEKSYSAFSSDLTVYDEEMGDFNYRVFMNNILDHRGYRLFQSSFYPNEKGTILSVNHDFWGTWITYFGYFMLYLGLLAILFYKGSRFSNLTKNLNKVKAKKAKLLSVFLFCFALSGLAQDDSRKSKSVIDSILRESITPKSHADAFGHMVIQDLSGRMMPVNTYASEMLRKLSKHDTYEGFNANQVFLSIHENPFLWYDVPIIYLKPKKGDSIRKLIGIDKTQKYATLANFFDEKGLYKLGPYLEAAYKAQPPSGFQKEFKEADQRVNLLFNTVEGTSLKIFPLPDNSNNKWISSKEKNLKNYKIKDSLYLNFINNGFDFYLSTLNEAKKTKNFKEPEKFLEAIKKIQNEYGSSVMISDDRINAEVRYNRYDVFKKLFSWYMYAGTFLFIVLIVQIFKDKNKIISAFVTTFKFAILLLFVIHTLGLIARWYISGHAPWSDAYESMIYVAWATMFFGLIFGRKSDLTIAATAFVTAMILMVAHWNWMDPAIANLQPVLDSYWLMIHVAVIVASYGPFTLGMILGLVVLLLMVFTTEANRKKMRLNIEELTIINEMALTVGLVMLTIGNFLGGMWANESWGRYWGWDPKETWALISIMIYAFVLHMRLVPGLRGRFGFNLASIIAFSSIMMTYFGVNFYLAGLHSYASGDQIVSLKFIGYTLGIIAIIAFFAYRKYHKYYKK